MREWERLSSVQLGKLIQRLYMRLEQYEIHVASLADSPQRDVAMVLADRMRKRVDDASAFLDLAEAIRPGCSYAGCSNGSATRQA
jgi:hypothetical protein